MQCVKNTQVLGYPYINEKVTNYEKLTEGLKIIEILCLVIYRNLPTFTRCFRIFERHRELKETHFTEKKFA